jgi:hypothetical protein
MNCAGLLDAQVAFLELHVGRHWETPQQTEGLSFGDISEAVKCYIIKCYISFV